MNIRRSKIHVLRRKVNHLVSGWLISLLLIPVLLAYDNPLVSEIQPRNIMFNRYGLTLYDLSINPALFGISYPDNIDYYQTRYDNYQNTYRRTFDPGHQNNYEIRVISVKHLSERVTLLSGIQYNRTVLSNVYRSLEKNFYDEFFTICDTTTGSIAYDGPQVRFLYDYALTNRIHLACEINYGVEEGLKDIYTKCETIVRNTELRGGISFISGNQKTVLGLTGVFYDAQRKYEAVKDLQDAFAITNFGLHVSKAENPRSTIRKNDDRGGGEIDLQMIRKDFLRPGMTLKITTGYCGRSDYVSTGSVQKPNPRGYWVRQVYRGITSLIYAPNSEKSRLDFLYEYRLTGDWAKSGNHDVVIMENKEILNAFNLNWQFHLLKRLLINTGGYFTANACDYREYIVPFKYDQTDNQLSAFLNIALQVNPILSVYLLGDLKTIDLYYYWNADRATRYSGEFGLERLTTFGRFGVAVETSQTTFNGTDRKDRSIGIKLAYWR